MPIASSGAYERAFAFANAAAVVAWLALAKAQFDSEDDRETRKEGKQSSRKYRSSVYTSVVFAVVITGLCAAYLAIALNAAFARREISFASLADIRALFARDDALFAGWIHYLAFDLLVGERLGRNERARGVPRAWTVACTLPLTFVAGPIGACASAIGCRAFGRR